LFKNGKKLIILLPAKITCQIQDNYTKYLDSKTNERKSLRITNDTLDVVLDLWDLSCILVGAEFEG
ncbi:hypothetical protein, partial [Klebsiella variicola]|uniref:hypothetical protein n=1 Tax=Klebsiella variicola TaxID=244366 RepID=UPI00272FE10D